MQHFSIKSCIFYKLTYQNGKDKIVFIIRKYDRSDPQMQDRKKVADWYGQCITNSIRLLSGLLSAHCEKEVILLIDEYDVLK